MTACNPKTEVRAVADAIPGASLRAGRRGRRLPDRRRRRPAHHRDRRVRHGRSLGADAAAPRRRRAVHRSRRLDPAGRRPRATRSGAICSTSTIGPSAMCVRDHGGRVVKYTGDGVLALVPSATGAVEAAQSIASTQLAPTGTSDPGRDPRRRRRRARRRRLGPRGQHRGEDHEPGRRGPDARLRRPRVRPCSVRAMSSRCSGRPLSRGSPGRGSSTVRGTPWRLRPMTRTSPRANPGNGPTGPVGDQRSRRSESPR